jgi:hypothetical protein
MKKVFIKVARTYQVKNKLQKQILENLKEFDGVLTNQQTANKLIKIAYSDAVNNYKGTAAVPELRNSKSDENNMLHYVEDVIYLNVHQVINDLT